jgi:xanthine/uracil/vitamin C permease (AzgA family)
MSADPLIRLLRRAWPLLNATLAEFSLRLSTHVPIGLGPTTWTNAFVAFALGLLWGGALWAMTIWPESREQQK